MNIIMQSTRESTIDQLESFLKGSAPFTFEVPQKDEIYTFVPDFLREQNYFKRSKKEKGILREFIIKITGFSRSQITRWIHEFKKTGTLKKKQYNRPCFPQKYTSNDRLLLVEVDKAHGVLSGPATVCILKREFSQFRKEGFVNLAKLSVSHLYNLRKTERYRTEMGHFEKTRPVRVPLGERVKPRPQGKPGFIRVDTVHQGDREGEKGVYYINLVDEVTQWELVCCVEKISEQYLVPVLEAALLQFPFFILNFHADNGSEYINKYVVALLNGMKVRLTKCRPYHSGDNGLVECKNGAIIRKHLGYAHIPQHNASRIHLWLQNYMNPYLNFHRPCAFPVEKIDKRGKRIRSYPKDQYKTPYEKLKSLSNASSYLTPAVSFEKLNSLAYALSDTDYAKILQQQKHKLFNSLTFPASFPFQAHL